MKNSWRSDLNKAFDLQYQQDITIYLSLHTHVYTYVVNNIMLLFPIITCPKSYHEEFF